MAGAVQMESGVLYSSTMAQVRGVTTVRMDAQVSYTDVRVMDRGKPLEQRPIMNYVPINLSFDKYKQDNSLEQMLGLINSTGLLANIYDTTSTSATYGIRSMQMLLAPMSSQNYNSLYDIKSGVLTSYSVQGSVSEPIRQSVAFQCLYVSGSPFFGQRDPTNYASSIVRPEGQNLTGIQFTGMGITGFNIQSFSFGVNFTRTTIMQLNSRYPTSRPITDCVATLQVQGYFDGLNNSFSGFNGIVNGQGTPIYGTVGLTMLPANASPCTITSINPYWTNLSINGQVGGFTTASISLEMPIGPNYLETGDGSVVIFS